MRLHVTGNAGAGKTTLSREIAHRLQLPLQHLDSVVWEPNWQKPDAEQKSAAIKSLCHGSDWVIDGVSELVRWEADIVIFLDTPRIKCLYRCIRRCFQWGFSTRPELPENCPEMKILFKAIKIVWRFPGTIRKQILSEAQEKPNYIICKDTVDADRQLQHLCRTLGVPR